MVLMVLMVLRVLEVLEVLEVRSTIRTKISSSGVESRSTLSIDARWLASHEKNSSGETSFRRYTSTAVSGSPHGCTWEMSGHVSYAALERTRIAWEECSRLMV